MEFVWITLIVFGFALIVFGIALWRFPEEVRSLIRRTASVQISGEGIAWTIFQEAIEEKEGREASAAELRPELSRLAGGRILWVDDSPANNRLEVQSLRAAGVEIDTATSNQEALSYLGRSHYDLVLSDVHRPPPQEPEAGLALDSLLREAGVSPPIAYYVGEATGAETPGGQPVFDTPTDLLRHVATVLAGRR